MSDPGKRAANRIARAFLRIAGTEDGKVMLAYLEKAIGWDEAGPGNPEVNSLQFWTGQRSVVKLVRDQIAMGQKLVANPETEDDE